MEREQQATRHTTDASASGPDARRTTHARFLSRTRALARGLAPGPGHHRSHRCLARWRCWPSGSSPLVPGCRLRGVVMPLRGPASLPPTPSSATPKRALCCPQTRQADIHRDRPPASVRLLVFGRRTACRRRAIPSARSLQIPGTAAGLLILQAPSERGHAQQQRSSSSSQRPHASAPGSDSRRPRRVCRRALRQRTRIALPFASTNRHSRCLGPSTHPPLRQASPPAAPHLQIHAVLAALPTAKHVVAHTSLCTCRRVVFCSRARLPPRPPRPPRQPRLRPPAGLQHHFGQPLKGLGS